MKITFKGEWQVPGTTVEIVSEEECIHEVVENFKLFLLGCGFQKENIDEYLDLD